MIYLYIQRSRLRFITIFLGFMKNLHSITFLLLVIGGLNWLLFGLFNWDIGQLFGGMDSMISRLIYILVGISAIVEIAQHKANCKACADKSSRPAA
jgi:uncharacterized membrane protein YuzA (DUF378 family)